MNESSATRELLVALAPGPAPMRRQLATAIADAVRGGRLQPGSAAAVEPRPRRAARRLAWRRHRRLRPARRAGVPAAAAAACRRSSRPARRARPTIRRNRRGPGSVRLHADDTRRHAVPARCLAPRPRARAAERTRQRLDYGDHQGSERLRIALAERLGRVPRRRHDAATPRRRPGLRAGSRRRLRIARRARKAPPRDRGPCARRRRPTARLAGMEHRPVPVDADGIDVAALAETRADAVLVTPAHQFPTGVMISPDPPGASSMGTDARRARHRGRLRRRVPPRRLRRSGPCKGSRPTTSSTSARPQGARTGPAARLARVAADARRRRRRRQVVARQRLAHDRPARARRPPRKRRLRSLPPACPRIYRPAATASPRRSADNCQPTDLRRRRRPPPACPRPRRRRTRARRPRLGPRHQRARPPSYAVNPRCGPAAGRARPRLRPAPSPPSPTRWRCSRLRWPARRPRRGASVRGAAPTARSTVRRCRSSTFTPDELLSTTRAVKRRLDLARPVPAELLHRVRAARGAGADVDELAAPGTSLIVTDAATRAAVAAPLSRPPGARTPTARLQDDFRGRTSRRLGRRVAAPRGAPARGARTRLPLRPRAGPRARARPTWPSCTARSSRPPGASSWRRGRAASAARGRPTTSTTSARWRS